MSVVDEGLGQVARLFQPTIDMIKRRIFGANNERLDFIMDSFYKLAPQQQTAAIFGFAGLLGLLLLGIFGVYFARIATLENDLNNGYEALREIRALGADYRQEKSRLEWLSRNVDSKTASFRPKTFFEKKAKQVGVTLESLRSEEVEISSDNPLSNSFKEVQVVFRIPKVSIQRLLKFMSELEKSGKTLTVRNLRIRARYGDRLYFDTEAQVSGYKKL